MVDLGFYRNSIDYFVVLREKLFIRNNIFFLMFEIVDGRLLINGFIIKEILFFEVKIGNYVEEF